MSFIVYTKFDFKSYIKSTMDERVLISVIIPIYKSEKYLSQCIESVIFQTLIDFELLLIDDGSPDA